MTFLFCAPSTRGASWSATSPSTASDHLPILFRLDLASPGATHDEESDSEACPPGQPGHPRRRCALTDRRAESPDRLLGGPDQGRDPRRGRAHDHHAGSRRLLVRLRRSRARRVPVPAVPGGARARVLPGVDLVRARGRRPRRGPRRGGALRRAPGALQLREDAARRAATARAGRGDASGQGRGGRRARPPGERSAAGGGEAHQRLAGRRRGEARGVLDVENSTLTSFPAPPCSTSRVSPIDIEAERVVAPHLDGAPRVEALLRHGAQVVRRHCARGVALTAVR
jgi:hypothetical protein